MQDRSHLFQDRLFIASGAAPDRISNFSCGHVIPPENLLPLVIPAGPTGHRLDFTYGSRDKAETLDELYRVLSNASNVIPGGVVCFFPSYDYEERVRRYFEKKGNLESLAAKKPSQTKRRVQVGSMGSKDSRAGPFL